jgi:hypothetical protein
MQRVAPTGFDMMSGKIRPNLYIKKDNPGR